MWLGSRWRNFYERAFGNSYSLPGFGPRGKVQNKMQELDDVLAQ